MGVACTIDANSIILGQCSKVALYTTYINIHNSSTMDQIITAVEPLKQFSKDSVRLVKRCTKPDKKEFQKIAIATAIGFALMGFIGFFVKLIHIPINNIIVGA